MHRRLSLLAVLAAVAFQSGASEFIATNAYLVGKDTIVADEQWVLTGLAETEGIFKNDLHILSGNPLHLNGTFEGNISGMASTDANLAGTCLRNVRLSGKTVKIDGSVGGNVMALAETIIIGTNAVIEGNVRLFGTSIIQEGTIRGNAHLSSARIVTLGGAIGGNVKVVAPDILIPRDTTIGGNLSYTANKELFPPEGAVAGTLARVVPEAQPLFSTARLTTKAMWFMAAFLAGVPFIALFPMTTAMAGQLVRKAPWKCLLVGFLASGALPVFGIMCVSSIIGVPLGVLILASWGLMFYLSRIIMGLVIGTLILRRGGTSIARVLLAMAIGLAGIYLTTVIPSIGVPVQMMVLWLGMGSFILA
ncbi:MAG: polymer-forming cytoskeletal protein, partial [Pontiella sp.]|nr:polymer-forming cytoskeletal protein [Pontiella sp.]